MLKNSTHMRVGCINSQGDGYSGFRVNKDRDRGEEDLGLTESGVKNRGLLERFNQTHKGVG